ncbi:MAG: GIY-YIG nuclease family protein [Eubacteriales bacterium]
MNKEKETITITYDELEGFLNELGSKFDLQRYELTLNGNGYYSRKITDLTSVMWNQLKNKDYNSDIIVHELFKDVTYDIFIEAYSSVVGLLNYSKNNRHVYVLDNKNKRYVYPPFPPLLVLDCLNDYTANKIIESGILPRANEVYNITLEFLQMQRSNMPQKKKKSKTTKGIVYLLERTDKPQYKIGVTTNMERRLNQLTPKMPFEVIVANKIKSNDIYGLEAKLHKKYKDKHINGEWFALDKKDVEYIKSIEGDF